MGLLVAPAVLSGTQWKPAEGKLNMETGKSYTNRRGREWGQELVYHQVSVCDVQVPSILEVGLSWVSFPLWRWTQGLDTPHKRSAVSQFAALSWLYVDPSGVSLSAYLPLVTSAVCTAKMTEVPAGCQDPTAGRGVMGEWHTRQGDGCCYDRNTGVVLAGTGEEILTEPSSYPW